MVAAVAEPEVYTGRVPTAYAERMRERRRLDAVASDLIASSRRVEVPDGIFTVVNAKFLGELLDVCHATGERLFVVVDDYHLARFAQVAGVAGIVNEAPLEPKPSSVVRPDDIKAVRKWNGWTTERMGQEFGVSKSTANNWQYGYTLPGPEHRVRLRQLIAEMKAAQAVEQES